MRWHFNLFKIDQGYKATKFQLRLYKFVNRDLPWIGIGLYLVWWLIFVFCAFFTVVHYTYTHLF